MPDAPEAPDRRAVGIRLSIETARHHDPREPTHTWFPVGLAMEVADDPDLDNHSYALTRDQTAALAGWLRAAEGAEDGPLGEAVDPDGDRVALARRGATTQLIFSDDADTDTYAIPLASAGPLADALDRALASLAASPPVEITDHLAGQIAGWDSAGAPAAISPVVESAVSDLESPQITLDLAGTWWFVDDEVLALSHAFDAAAAGPGEHLALCEPGKTEPWLSVARSGDRVTLRLYDELVAEGPEDGVFVTDPGGARAFAEALRAALAHQAANPPHVYAPPEPFQRETERLPFPWPHP